MNPIELADIILSMIKNVYNSASDTSKDFFKVAILSVCLMKCRLCKRVEVKGKYCNECNKKRIMYLTVLKNDMKRRGVYGM